MTDHLDNESENPEPTLSETTGSGREPVSPGHMLRSAREQQEMSIDALTASTSLSESIIESLERNRFDQLPQSVFVRGYYRKCAKALEMPEQPLLEAYANWAGEEESRPLASGPVDVTPHDVTVGSGGSRVFRTFLMIVLLIVVIAIIWALLPGFMDALTRQETGPKESVAEIDQVAPLANGGGAGDEETAESKPSLGPPINSEPGANGRAEAGASPGPEIRMGNLSAGGATPDTADEDAEGQGQVPSATADEPATAGSGAAAGADNTVPANKLVLEFNHRSWISVEGANGNTLLEGLVEADQRRVIKAQLPYHIVLGYAPGVDVTLGGRSIEFSGQIEADNTAELTLGSAGQ